MHESIILTTSLQLTLARSAIQHFQPYTPRFKSDFGTNSFFYN